MKTENQYWILEGRDLEFNLFVDPKKNVYYGSIDGASKFLENFRNDWFKENPTKIVTWHIYPKNLVEL